MNPTHVTSPEAAPPSNPPEAAPHSNDEPILVEDLIEEVSIDGMCGVY